jgi:membrane protein YqaA with SNARE-associated domain
MKGLVAWIQAIAVGLGGTGLFAIAFLDSSFLSFPEVVDLLVMGLVVRHKERLIYYALMPTLGSIAGCFVLYMLARKGGEAFIRKRFHERHVDRAMAVFQKYGLFAVAIPAILPPPVPLKLFVLAAGVAGVRPVDFIAAIAIGRGIRYFGEALIALWYGDQAIDFVHRNATRISIWLALAIAVAGIAYALWRRRRRAMNPTA